MDVRFGRWWPRRPAEVADPKAEVATTEVASSDALPNAAEVVRVEPASVGRLPHADPVPLPEQPVLVPARATNLPSRVGVVLPAARPGALLRYLPIPRVPKRAVLAIGICAGLAAPAVGRQLAVQALLGLLGPTRATRPLEGATVEIIRVHYAGSAAGHAASAVTKILEQVRR